MGKMPRLFFGILMICALCGKLYAGGDARARYDEAIRYTKLKQPDFALMEFRSILQDFPKTVFAQKALFAIAEYCYDRRMHYEAIRNFTAHINDYPGSAANVFARAYLLKIMQDIREPNPEERRLFEEIKTAFFSKPLFLLFSEYKKTSYKSPSQNKFKIRYYVGNIEVYRNGQLFVKLTP